MLAEQTNTQVAYKRKSRNDVNYSDSFGDCETRNDILRKHSGSMISSTQKQAFQDLLEVLDEQDLLPHLMVVGVTRRLLV